MALSMRTWMVLAATLGLSATFASRAEDAPAGDAAHGAKIAYTCFGCHGIPDYRNAYPNYHVPEIGGQHAAYLAAALTEYRSGARSAGRCWEKYSASAAMSSSFSAAAMPFMIAF